MQCIFPLRIRCYEIELPIASVAQVAEDLGDRVEILKVDTEVEQDLASQLQIQVRFSLSLP